jgi:hypothetical protein
MSKVLIVSALYEPSVNRVINALDRRGTKWVRFNTETFPLLAFGTIQFYQADHSWLINLTQSDSGVC